MWIRTLAAAGLGLALVAERIPTQPGRLLARRLSKAADWLDPPPDGEEGMALSPEARVHQVLQGAGLDPLQLGEATLRGGDRRWQGRAQHDRAAPPA